MNYREYFTRLTGLDAPHQWQRELGEADDCCSRLIRIPTGFGKTLGVLAAWTYHRVRLADKRWPSRLVWCLPMRVLVEQTESEVRTALSRLDVLWDNTGDHAGKVGVHLLMGGADSDEWHLHPEHAAVLIGTQDMLLSRALNRGYGAARGRWPMDFGLLNQDALWVMDEVQLMDVGLATSGQLQSFRLDEQHANRTARPCHTWWMSATLQRSWLQLSPETQVMATEVPQNAIAPEARRGRLWDDVTKSVTVEQIADLKQVARLAVQAHAVRDGERKGLTLVVLNRVDDAVEVYAQVCAMVGRANTDVRLLHSRFRGHERAGWREAFLNREACEALVDRIVIATQVVEAGVDISAEVLITHMAPWSSLVQRFGRAARWGGRATVIVADFRPKDDKASAPYTKQSVDAAREALVNLSDVAPIHLEDFEDEHSELLSTLYSYAPKHLLTRGELDELFDTTPDLSGADIDISRFIRSGVERDLQLFWEDISNDRPDRNIKPAQKALCAVPAYRAQKWLCRDHSEQLRDGMRAWVWDYLDGSWRDAKRRDLYPGQTVMIAAESGGYDERTGWSPRKRDRVTPVRPGEIPAEERSDASQDDESLSAAPSWQTIAFHGRAVGREARKILERLELPRKQLFDLAGRWHDAGKIHEAFSNSIRGDLADRPRRNDIAKAPSFAWLPPKRLYQDSEGRRRAGFRHELASTLSLFAVLERHCPDHPALLGPWRSLLELSGAHMKAPEHLPIDAPGLLEQEILALSAEDFDLLAYLICSHHGKVRCSWHASPADQAAADSVLRIRGVRDGDVLPPLTLATDGGQFAELPASSLHLDGAAAGLNPRTGRGWSERVVGLLGRYGPFTLAYLEAVLRAADQRASRLPLADPLIESENGRYGLEEGNRGLAQATSGGASAQTPGSDSTPRSQFHGDGERAGERAGHSHEPERPATTTRYVDTTLGVLSYAQLAPHVAARVASLEADIADRLFAQQLRDETLLLEFHRRICADLIPGIAGQWRRHDVRVASHEPPQAWRVPMLVRDYGADLTERLSHVHEWSDERLIELLVFAEGRLLNIHPFADFNGRVTRVFLIELLYRLDWPVVDTATSSETDRQSYFAALRAYDEGNDLPLAAIWRQRLGRGVEG